LFICGACPRSLVSFLSFLFSRNLLYSIRFRLWQIERFLLQSDLRSPSRISRVSVDYLTDSETQPRPFIVDDGGFAPVISGPVIFAPGIYISCTRYLPPLHPSTLGPPAPTSTVTTTAIPFKKSLSQELLHIDTFNLASTREHPAIFRPALSLPVFWFVYDRRRSRDSVAVIVLPCLLPKLCHNGYTVQEIPKPGASAYTYL
jgi:hypothetical protein